MEDFASNSNNRNISANSIRILITEDHELVRYAIRRILEESPNFEVVGEAFDAETSLRLLAEQKPDLLLLDISLPGKSGLETIYQIRESGLDTKIVVLTMHDDEIKVKQALSAGATGYILKHVSPDLLIADLNRVASGDTVVPEKFAYLIGQLATGTSRAETKKSTQDPLDKLSKREREVFFLLAEGSPNRVIAKKLFISPRTVETHRARVIKKLGFGSTADLIRYAIRHSLLSA